MKIKIWVKKQWLRFQLWNLRRQYSDQVFALNTCQDEMIALKPYLRATEREIMSLRWALSALEKTT